MILKNLKYAGFDEALIEECKGWHAEKGRKFVLEKDQAVFVPTSLDVIKVGLGWSTTCDIDTSMIMLDSAGNQIDLVFYGKKLSSDSSIKHSGDDTTGEGSGDDETIICYLNKVDKRVDSIWPVITIYTAGR